jgi:DNA-binding NtrC family response regulator
MNLPPSESPRWRILIVDNEPGFHELFSFHLEPMHFAVTSAYDGEAGWKAFAAGEFDIVFSDVHMPGLTGPDLLIKIKNFKSGQPVVMMSSASDGRMVFERESRAHGAVTCLYKPFTMDQLDKAIQLALGVRN